MVDLADGATLDVVEPAVTFDVIQPQVTRDLVVLEGPPGSSGTNGTNGTDGRSVVSVDRTSGTGAAGTVDTYTITYSSGDPSTFQVRNGNNGRGITSVARTSGTGAAGTTDTYTITYSNSTTSTFTVTNGANGTNGTNGQGVPTGGTTGQVLTKTSAADYATAWQTPAAGGGGGAGVLLGRAVSPTGIGSEYTVSSGSAPVALGGTTYSITFTATTTAVRCVLLAVMSTTASGGTVLVCLRNGTTNVPNSEQQVAVGIPQTTVNHEMNLTGLTVGQSYTVTPGWRTTTAQGKAAYGGSEFTANVTNSRVDFKVYSA